MSIPGHMCWHWPCLWTVDTANTILIITSEQSKMSSDALKCILLRNWYFPFLLYLNFFFQLYWGKFTHKTVRYIKYTLWSFGICTYCERITPPPIWLINTSISLFTSLFIYLFIHLFLVRIFKFYSYKISILLFSFINYSHHVLH